MFKKIAEWWSDPDWSEPWWSIRAFLLQPIVPTKTIEWIEKNKCSYNGSSENGKWDYYWYGSFKKGYEVKVRREVA